MRDRISWAAGALGLVLLLAGGCGVLFGLHLEVVLVAGALTIGAALTSLTLFHALLHRRLTRSLAARATPGSLGGEAVNHVSGVGPMVAGLLRPQVYCDATITTHLGPDEQRAVLLHERCHQQRRDPVRLLLLRALQTVFGWVPGVPGRIDDARARLEIRADRYALRNGATRPQIAAALLRLGGLTPHGAAAFGTVTEQRLQALLDDRSPTRSWRVPVSLAAAGVIAASACLPLLPASAPHDEIMLAARCLFGACGAAV